MLGVQDPVLSAFARQVPFQASNVFLSSVSERPELPIGFVDLFIS